MGRKDTTVQDLEKTNGIDPSKYVVLDVETNGLSSARYDLLSISIFKPDTGESYNRFLPLELNTEVLTTKKNGIKTQDLKGLQPLTQTEIDEIISAYDLKRRTILTYGNLDENFIVKYFQRHKLSGIDYFAFYNFKHEIISSKYSEGNITKDNLCEIYGINNVNSVHSGSNDCILEWKLFEKMGGHHLLVTNNKVFELNDGYFIPASYITSYPNLKYYLTELPQITCKSEVVFSLPVSGKKQRKFPTNFNGEILEHLINSMLGAKKINNKKFLLENKKKLKYLGMLPSVVDAVPMIFNPDGTMTATRPQDKKLAEEINATVKELMGLFSPLTDFIKENIFNGESIKSQELVISPNEKILALCDLSTEQAILEIKAANLELVQNYAEQLFFEANGRKCYVLLTNWSKYPGAVSYDIHKVEFCVKKSLDSKRLRFEEAKKLIESEGIELISFSNYKSPVRLKCKICGNEWNTSCKLAKKKRPCPNCSSTNSLKKQRLKKTSTAECNNITINEQLTAEEKKLVQRYLRFKEKVGEKSGNQLTILSFKDSRSPAKVKCMVCGREWEARADHILERPYCPSCKKR